MKNLITVLFVISVVLIAAGLSLEFEGTSSLFGYALASVGGVYLIAAVILRWSNFQNSYWERERGHG